MFEALFNESKTNHEAQQKRLEYLDKELARNNQDFDIEGMGFGYNCGEC